MWLGHACSPTVELDSLAISWDEYAVVTPCHPHAPLCTHSSLLTGTQVQTGMPSVSGGGGGGGGGGGYQPPAPAPEQPKQSDPLASIIPEAPSTNPFLDPAVAAEDAADSDTNSPASSMPTYNPPPQPNYGGPEAPSAPPSHPSGNTPPGGGGRGQSPYAPAPYVAPAAPYVAPAAPAPAPAAPARPRYSPAPERPKTPVPLPSGARRSGGGGAGSKPMEGNMADAMEHCRYAIRALEHKDVNLAVQKLQEALQQLT